MKILDIYEKYQIMPQLQTHMFRVAGVSSMICDNFKNKIDKKVLITASLLHDIGNIIKFDLQLFPEFTKEKGLQYWESVKEEYINKYGKDEHKATYAIAKGLKVSRSVFNLIISVGFAKTKQTYDSKDYLIKILAYSDLRVAPFKVLTLSERLEDLGKRYLKKKDPKYDVEEFNNFVNINTEIEKQIFENCKIKPDYITEEKVKPIIEELKNFEIITGNS